MRGYYSNGLQPFHALHYFKVRFSALAFGCFSGCKLPRSYLS